MSRPNVIVIMTDDQGYGDLSCMGATDFVTPHMDEVAASGIRFTCMYSNSPVCSPSRASLLTGRYPGNAGVRSILAGHRRATGLQPEIPTMGTIFKASGYRTGLVGKWHLGLAPESQPNMNGFDYFFGFMAGCIDYYSHVFYWGMADGHTNPAHDLWENDQEVYHNGEYATELITSKSVEFIRENKDQPFLLFVGYNAPHYPMHAPDKYLKRFAHLPWDRQIMAAMISAVDDGVGEIRAELSRQGILDNTIIYFQSDNGPSRESRNWMDGREDPYYGGKSGKFLGHKFSLFEGGIRVPALFSWPSTLASEQVIESPCVSMDILPTLLDAAQVPFCQDDYDGISLLSMLKGEGSVQHEAIYWEMGNQRAIRYGDYKLVLNGVLVEGEAPRAARFLCDLVSDPGEKRNLVGRLPELANQMEKKVMQWYEDMERYWNEHFVGYYQSLT
jgi:arylsulfatase A-like enzyme